jgi:hypothetical protein
MITPADIDFSPERSTAVVSAAQKFVIPVPAFADGGEALVYPDGDKAGRPLTDWQGHVREGRGIVFYNAKDRAYQAARGDGSAVIIINAVGKEAAAKLAAHIARITPSPESLSLAQLKKVLAFAREKLRLEDIYDSTREFVGTRMSKVSPDTGVAAYGLHKRDARDICQAVYLPGKGEFQGPAATPQRFTNGAVILKQGDDVRLIQPEVFEATYTHPDGRKLKVSDLPSFSRRAGEGAHDEVGGG